VLRKTDDGFEILGVPEGIEHLGGADFDDAVFDHVRRVLGSTFTDLNPLDPTVRAAAARLRAECVQAKEDLSRDTETTIPVSLPGIQTEVRLTRQEFEDLIRPSLMGTVESLRRALRSAKITPDQVAATVLAGGSSRIPLVAELIGSELRLPVAVGTHPKHAVALGAALIAGQDVGRSPEDRATGALAPVGGAVPRLTTEHWETDRVDPVTAIGVVVPAPGGVLGFDAPPGGKRKRKVGAPLFAAIAVAIVVAVAVTLVLVRPWQSTTAGNGTLAPGTTSTSSSPSDTPTTSSPDSSGTGTTAASSTGTTAASSTGTAAASSTDTSKSQNSSSAAGTAQLMAALPGIPSGVSCTATTIDLIAALIDPNTPLPGATGDLTLYGDFALGSRNASQMAVDEFNSRNPACPITLNVLDTQNKTAQAAAMAQQAVADPKVLGVVAATLSADVGRMGPILNGGSLPFVVPTAKGDNMNQKDWSTFNQVIASNSGQASAASYLHDPVGATKVAVIDDGSVYGTTITAIVRTELGGGVALSASLPAAPKTTPAAGEDFSALVTRITDAQADAVYFAGKTSRAGYLLKQLRAAGFTGTFMSAEGMSTPAFLKTAGAAASEGALFTCTCAPASASPAYEQAYHALFSAVPPDYSAEAFDATTIFLQGLAAGIHDRSSMTQYVRNYSGTGISKPKIAFDAHGYITGHPTWLYQIKDGVPVKVSILQG
jgi:ABC-type branched-subunit amino acid transport system substrate-binding protein